jgi:hypothetical protein
MRVTLQQLKDRLAVELYGKTAATAIGERRCIQCGQIAEHRCYSEAGREEFFISGLCEICFDDIVSIQEDLEKEDNK